MNREKGLMGDIKVTVYIPVYNYGKYVGKAIESVFKQTLKNWELLVINDGSTDETEKILKKYEPYDRVTIVNQENKGLTVTCNIALRLAKGEYFIRLDSDDYLDENALLVMSHFLDENPETGLVYPDYYLIDEHGEIVSVERRAKAGDKADILLDMPAHGACTMFRKRVLLEMGGYNEGITCQDGYDIWLRFIEMYKIGNVNLPLFYYRQHGGSLTENSKKILETRQKIKRIHAEAKKKKLKIKHIKRVAIIPARTHSNVVMRMALEKLGDKPLINYTIDEAIKSESFNRIVVVSEDDEIIKYTRENYPDVKSVKRPKKYARRNTGLEESVKMVLNILRQEEREGYQEGMLLFLEAPLKRSEHVIKAIDTMHIFDTDSVVPLCETYSPYYVRGKKGLERIGSVEQFRLERKIIYQGNGALLLFKTKNLGKGSIMGDKVGHIIMLREDSINIVSPFDYKVARVLLKERNETVQPRQTMVIGG